MEVTRKDIDKLNAEITVKLTPADYQDKVDAVLKQHRKMQVFLDSEKGWFQWELLKSKLVLA